MFWRLLFAATVLLLCQSCDSEFGIARWWPQSSFNGPFPKKHKPLNRWMGKQLLIKRGEDTLRYSIIELKNQSAIVNHHNGDTLLSGIVSTYRGLLFISTLLNDTAHYINPIKIKGNLLYGFQNDLSFMHFLDAKTEADSIGRMLIYHDKTQQVIRLVPNKQELFKLAKEYLNTLVPDTILWVSGATNPTSAVQTPLDESPLVERIYPNPFSDKIMISLFEPTPITYRILNNNGLLIGEGKLLEKNTRLNFEELEDGVYYLYLFGQEASETELYKLLKVENKQNE